MSLVFITGNWRISLLTRYCRIVRVPIWASPEVVAEERPREVVSRSSRKIHVGSGRSSIAVEINKYSRLELIPTLRRRSRNTTWKRGSRGQEQRVVLEFG